MSDDSKQLDSANKSLTESENAKQISGFLSPQFQTAFCGCLENPIGCALTFVVPCVPMATLKADLDGRDANCMDLICCPSGYQTRVTLRTKHGMKLAPLNDCIAHWCLPCCAVHQDIREHAKRSGKPPKFLMDASKLSKIVPE
jgi:Cys-rich protein (TIGR01571 family)